MPVSHPPSSITKKVARSSTLDTMPVSHSSPESERLHSLLNTSPNVPVSHSPPQHLLPLPRKLHAHHHFQHFIPCQLFTLHSSDFIHYQDEHQMPSSPQTHHQMYQFRTNHPSTCFYYQESCTFLITLYHAGFAPQRLHYQAHHQMPSSPQTHHQMYQVRTNHTQYLLLVPSHTSYRASFILATQPPSSNLPNLQCKRNSK